MESCCRIYYKLPYADEYTVITDAACNEYCSITDIPSQRGFVFAPFHSDSRHPILFFSGGREEKFAVPQKSIEEPKDSVLQHSQAETDTYQQTFDAALAMLRDNSLRKIVISTCTSTESCCSSPLDSFHKACASYPRMMVYMLQHPVMGIWIGCTPEVLLSGRRSHYRTVALAGTMKATEARNARWSAKNKCEQSVVADYIRQAISPYAQLIEEEGPFTSRAGELIHLKTVFHFTPSEEFSIPQFLSVLHPTPAVCGLPKIESLSAILRIEKHDREYYSGFVGSIDPSGDTDIYVNLRCANIKDSTTRYYAGGGILTSSIFQDEWNEICEKQKTIAYVL